MPITVVDCHYYDVTGVQIQIERSVEARQFRGILSSLANIGQIEGARGYFKGNGTNVVRIIPYVAVQFAAYEEFKKVQY